MNKDELIIIEKRKGIENGVLLPYSTPNLTVFGKIQDITRATKSYGQHADGVYTCGEDHNKGCYS
jgi:hypothetical protein